MPYWYSELSTRGRTSRYRGLAIANPCCDVQAIRPRSMQSSTSRLPRPKLGSVSPTRIVCTTFLTSGRAASVVRRGNRDASCEPESGGMAPLQRSHSRPPEAWLHRVQPSLSACVTVGSQVPSYHAQH